MSTDKRTMVINVLNKLALYDKAGSFRVCNRVFSDETKVMTVTLRDVNHLTVFQAVYEWIKPEWCYTSIIEIKAVKV